MDMEKRYHSVQLMKDQCHGCTNCLMHCPTEAIRVRNGRAHIIAEKCIDCGECIRICDYHAKVAITDKLSDIKRFRYSIALPAPSLYGQFRDLKSIGVVLDGLKKIGFDDVFEVARGADVVSRAIALRMRDNTIPRPIISSACPAVVRLIQVRFPDLIPNIMDVRQPMEIAASIAKDEFVRAHGCTPEEVGVFFITPCPAKMTAIRTPIGHEKSAVDGAISMMDIYSALRPHVRPQFTSDTPCASTSYGVGWASSSGESQAVCPEKSLAVDGIQNCIRILEEIENGSLMDLDFFEGNACIGGCVGGALAYENNYVARNTIHRLVEHIKTEKNTHPNEDVPPSLMSKYPLYLDQPIEANTAMRLDGDLSKAMRMLEKVNAITKELPGYDCGSCGSPTCRSFAQDIVEGYCGELDCIHKLKEKLKIMAEQMVELAQTKRT